MNKSKILPTLNKIELSTPIFGKPFKLDEETTIIPFNYSRGNKGYMCEKDGIKFSLTVNLMDTDKYLDNIILKMWGDAEAVNHKFIRKFKEVRIITVGINHAYVV